MKILIFTDLHCNYKSLKIIEKKVNNEKPELIICCGDFSIFGNGLNDVAKKINSFEIKTLIIPGNHETPQEIENLCKKYKNLFNLHEKIYKYKEWIFFGFGTGGFSLIEPRLENLINKLNKILNNKKNLIFITHAPIYNTKLDYLYEEHRGCKSSRKFIEKFKPEYTFCGHFHENENKNDKIKETLIINPGDKGIIINL